MRVETQKGILASEWHYLTQWKERVFPEEGRSKEWSPVSWHSIAYSEANDPIGHIGFDRFEVLIDAEPRFVIGIGGVVVRPEHQGQGIPALLFNEVHHQASKRLGADVFTLFCPSRLVSYYAKQGYQRHRGGVYFLQQGEKVLSTFEFMHCGELTADGEVVLQSEPW
ncbi:GNAT family N-acetyltransferase [Vreelandella zhaodongensis]|uniref:GNAT family N-acetyltransferase n=1 Tax=Vreelandella zhaodongensis TaxID=1176240 RepID=A0ABX2SU41_VREZH|nr:GNAT family N-acetyltransferase [Halomonas zhaodongensis]NYS45605.1 GNAT family N-acetyltransferase [Halomonas zhaodongensis]